MACITTHRILLPSENLGYSLETNSDVSGASSRCFLLFFSGRFISLEKKGSRRKGCTDMSKWQIQYKYIERFIHRAPTVKLEAPVQLLAAKWWRAKKTAVCCTLQPKKTSKQ
jgi:hypothetical protein